MEVESPQRSEDLERIARPANGGTRLKSTKVADPKNKVWVLVNKLSNTSFFMLHYCRMKHGKTKSNTVENTPKKEQKNLTQSAENQDNFLKFIAEIIVEIIIKETVHENNSTHQKDG